jgi:hypothetical protein
MNIKAVIFPKIIPLQTFQVCVRVYLAIIIVAVAVAPLALWADGPVSNGASLPDTDLQKYSTISLFQKFISPADGDRCAMHPSCSRYAQQAFKEEGLIKGWILTSDRLLRCGRDETRLAPTIYVKGAPHSYDPLDANTFWWKKR